MLSKESWSCTPAAFGQRTEHLFAKDDEGLVLGILGCSSAWFMPGGGYPGAASLGTWHT